MVKNYRDELQLFIEEQVQGPGISGFRFVNIDDAILEKNLSTLNAKQYPNELINIVPAGVYSTAILFPEDKSKSLGGGNVTPNDKEKLDEDQFSTEIDGDSIEETDSIQLDQMYPNTMGLTCCLSEDAVGRVIKVRLQGRYYTKLKESNNEFPEKFGVRFEIDPEVIRRVLANTRILAKLIFHSKGPNTVITFNKISSDEIGSFRFELRRVNETNANEINHSVSEFDFKLKVMNLSALKQSCYYELKNNRINEHERLKLYEASQKVELIENVLSHIDDLIDLHDTRSYGLWRSTKIDEIVELPEPIPSTINGKLIYSYKDQRFQTLRHIFKNDLGSNKVASLSLNFQLSVDTRKGDRKIFLKVQLVNTSTAFTKEADDSRYYSTFNEEVNNRCFFGVSLQIQSDQLIPYNSPKSIPDKVKYDEEDTTKFIYRQFLDYAVGHGCSVTWRRDSAGVLIETSYLPTCDTPDVDPNPRNKEAVVQNDGVLEPSYFLTSTNALEFKWLSLFSKTGDDEILKGLQAFVNAYQQWIDIKRLNYSEANEHASKIIHQELLKCEGDRIRMSSNIEKFLSGETNKTNLNSFRLMNSAMFMQLWHSTNVKNGKVLSHLLSESFSGFDFKFYEGADDVLSSTSQGKAAWRPFQLAFILLNLDGIFKPSDDSKWTMRNGFVDLVWFPTGGGKTEAYLGIIALTIINRRREHNSRGGGTAAIMRYTLRLLTLQQFQRATLLIMALELMRRWNQFEFGSNEPIFIGLWVGDNSLPNRMSPATSTDQNNLLTEFRKLSEGKRSKVPFDYCPWCKSDLSPSLSVNEDTNSTYYYNRLLLKCSNERCSFSISRPSRARMDQGPIPVSLCDDEIYQHPPALLFGTVDKFAQLAHKVSSADNQRQKDSRRIFGVGNWEAKKPKEGYLPPDLIIQDELHLLLGPLGSSVALFESAIDQLCTRADGTRPKVISSTATTRNTDLQIMALFGREVNLFPKPGVECDDSFFAFYRRRYQNSDKSNVKYLSKRRYLGILPTGKTQIWMQMRLAAVLLTFRAVFELKYATGSPLEREQYQQLKLAMDYYHTVLSYFNSLKEVGRTESQVHTYILKEIRRVFNRVIRPQRLLHSFYTYTIRKGELTGRLSGEEVKTELEKAKEEWDVVKRLASSIDGSIVRGHSPVDFIVATNMISVGIDVSRFNSILINSMPRNIAEYIQATSRVGRESFGLVLTIHHPFRARDVSHFEKFIEFHEKMYSYVEPISITPFTKKAVDRYLGLYLATMLRHKTGFTDRDSARRISTIPDADIDQMLLKLTKYFDYRRRSLMESSVDKQVKHILKSEDVNFIRQWIRSAIKEWNLFEKEVSSRGEMLVFNNKAKSSPRQRQEQLYVAIEEYEGNIHSDKWQVPMSLRVIEPEASIKIKQR